jgi:pyruvate-formate lyase-activating enzyme
VLCIDTDKLNIDWKQLRDDTYGKTENEHKTETFMENVNYKADNENGTLKRE